MIPPPMTSSRFGIDAGDRAPVESMIRGSSGRPGSVAACEPAAMMQFSNVISRSPTRSEFGPVNLPDAVDDLDLALLGEPVEPPVSRSTTDAFHPSSASRSTFGLPNVTPCAAISSASAITRAACSSALEGMQPTFRHTPPSRS